MTNGLGPCPWAACYAVVELRELRELRRGPSSNHVVLGVLRSHKISPTSHHLVRGVRRRHVGYVDRGIHRVDGGARTTRISPARQREAGDNALFPLPRPRVREPGETEPPTRALAPSDHNRQRRLRSRRMLTPKSFVAGELLVVWCVEVRRGGNSSSYGVWISGGGGCVDKFVIAML